MVSRRNGQAFECITIDLNTQRDYCERNGACPVLNIDELIPALRRVVAWTKWNCAPVISSLDSHRPCEVVCDERPVHCVDGSTGQQKMPFTRFPQCARIEVDNTLSIPLDLFRRFQQVLFRIRTDDLLNNPKADRFVTQLPVKEFVVYGNALEYSVKALVLGLLARDKVVTVVQDACGFWNPAAADLAIRQMEAKGAQLVTVDELLVRRLTRHQRYAALALRDNRRTRNGRSGTRSRTPARSVGRPSSPRFTTHLSGPDSRRRQG